MRTALGRTTALLVALAIPVAGEGAPRISLAPVRGDASGALSKQLRSVLCGEYECVPYSKVRTRGKLDFAKVEALQVAGILAGTVASRKGGKALEVALLKQSLRPVWKRSYPLTRGGSLPRDSGRDLAEEIGNLLAGERPARAETPPPAPVVTPPAAPPPPPVTPAPAAEPPPVAAAPPAAPPKAPSEAPAAAPPQPAKAPVSKRVAPAPLVALEAGVDLAQRKLDYQGVPAGASALRGFEATLVVSPRFHLELYPLSLATGGVFAGLGLFADYAFSVGLETKDPAGGAAHSTSYSRLGGGVLWRFHPVASSRFALIPAVSYQQLKFTVGGAPIPGLPDADLSGWKGGIDAEIPIGDTVGILLGVGYVKWTTARDLLDDGFFPSGSAYALEAEAGVSVALGGAFSLRLVGAYSGTRYSLESSPGGTYQATGATDQYLGGRAMLRAQF